MISKEVYMDIKAMHRRGMSMRAIARQLGIHRNTVKRHLESDSFPEYRKRKRKESLLDRYKQVIDDYLAEGDYQATWIFERIKAMGYEGSYKTVQKYVRRVRERRTRLAYIRFETEPGYQAQVDWGEFQFDGTKVYAFVMVLGYSRSLYVEFVKERSLETFFDCHIRAFKYFGGIPEEILYDNMKQVVIERRGGHIRFNLEFMHFCNHYGFTSKLCPPYSPWVKGKVERPMSYIRERFCKGYEYRGLERLNRDIRAWLDNTANKRRHGTHNEIIQERLDFERKHLQALPPKDFDTSIKVFRKVYKDCQISYNGNRYVVPHSVVGKKVMLKIKTGLIKIYHDDTLLASYIESPGKHQVIGDRRFYPELMRDISQKHRKYKQEKRRVTLGLTTGSLYPQVEYRPLSEYDRLIPGGTSWSS